MNMTLLETSFSKLFVPELILEHFEVNPLDILYGEEERLTLSQKVQFQKRKIRDLEKMIEQLRNF